MNLQEADFVIPFCVIIYKVTIDNVSDLYRCILTFAINEKKLHNSRGGLCPV